MLDEAGRPYSIVHQWDRLFKPHGNTLALRILRGGNVSKRQEYVRGYWSHPKRGNVRSLVPTCHAYRNGGAVLCVSGENSRHGTMHAVFCPTHTQIMLMPSNTTGVVSESLAGADSEAVLAVRRVLGSPFLQCTSKAVITDCISAGDTVWCTVSRKNVDRAVRSCAGLKPSDSDIKHADNAADNVLYQCQTG